MRQSAKLNVFRGVRNLSEKFLPPHLKYLQTYFTREPMNALLPVSLVVATLVAAPLWRAATAAGIGEFEMESLTLAATPPNLAILEHIFLAMPLPLDGVWKWGLHVPSTVGGSPATVAARANPER